MVAFVRRRAGHLVDPEDVLQQASVRAIAKSEQLREAEHVRAWLFRIVRNVLADELRAIGLPVVDREQQLEDAAAATEREEREPSVCKCSLEVAKSLKPEYAQILERVVVEDVPVTKLAAELGVTANNAMVRLHRARKALRSKLEEHCGTTSPRSCLDCGCEERGCCATR
jgi:RNA polymerase sigma-70 factor (ECF subfamily)